MLLTAAFDRSVKIWNLNDAENPQMLFLVSLSRLLPLVVALAFGWAFVLKPLEFKSLLHLFFFFFLFFLL